MDNQDLVQTFAEFRESKNIDRPTMALIIEEVFRAVLIKNHGSDDNYDVIINVDKGDFEIWRVREVVEDGEVEDDNRQISLTEARRIEPDYEVGEEVTEEVKFSDFARRNIVAIRQNLVSRIADLDRHQRFERYKDRVGELITAEISQPRKREVVLVDEEGKELYLPKAEQIPNDYYRKGDMVRAVIKSVEMANNGPIITLSRTDPKFLECLMEQEVPEIFDGLITVKKVVRFPGLKAKVAVESYDDRVDPVGACVGVKGSRIHAIVRELGNENIDVINYTNNINLYISRALSPATINSMRIDDERKQVEVFLSPNDVAIAIGKSGSNIHLASLLTGYKIDVYRDSEGETEEDIMLGEFSDEIDPWIIDVFRGIGCDTAKSVLEKTPEFLVQQTDLEEETVAFVIEVLRKEFEE